MKNKKDTNTSKEKKITGKVSPMPLMVTSDMTVVTGEKWARNMEKVAEHALHTLPQDEVDEICLTANNRTADHFKAMILDFIASSEEFNVFCEALQEYKYNVEVTNFFDCLFEKSKIVPMYEEDMLYVYMRNQHSLDDEIANIGSDLND